jgi:hypothetical protein
MLSACGTTTATTGTMNHEGPRDGVNHAKYDTDDALER